jgi:hypothetical protein
MSGVHRHARSADGEAGRAPAVVSEMIASAAMVRENRKTC